MIEHWRKIEGGSPLSMTKHVISCLMFFLLLNGIHGLANDLRLITNFGNQASPETHSEPRNFYAYNGLVYFEATVEKNGIWVTDGTEAGTHLFIDDVEFNPVGLLNGNLLFNNLSITNGTHSGTNILAKQSAVEESVQLTSSIVYRNSEGLFRTDGSVEGTILLKDANVTDIICSYSGWVYFTVSEGNGFYVWKTDGTVEGTEKYPALFSGTVRMSEALPNGLFFQNSSFLNSLDYDFSSHEQIYEDLYFPIVFDYIRLGDEVLFQAAGQDLGVELWKSDGTATGTQLVKDITAGGSGSFFSSMVNLGSHVLFIAGSNKKYLWKTDGTEQGTQQVHSTGWYTYSFPVGYTETSVLFLARTSETGLELWVTDGTDSGTFLFFESVSGSDSKNFSNFTKTSNGHYFSLGGNQLWFTDATTDGTHLVKEVHSEPDLYPLSDFYMQDDSLYFRGYDPVNGFEPWISDGTSDGTVLLKDIQSTGNKSSGFLGNETLKGYLYSIYKGNDDFLFETGGSPETNSLSGQYFSLSEVVVSDEAVFLTGVNWSQNEEVAVYQPANNSYTTLFEFGSSSENTHFFPTSSGVYFFHEGGNRPRLYFTDGTIEGTFEHSDLHPSCDSVAPFLGDLLFVEIESDLYAIAPSLNSWQILSSNVLPQLYQCGNHVFFNKEHEYMGIEPCFTDGTVEGTRSLIDLTPGFESSDCSLFTAWKDEVYFVNHGKELWKTDLSEEGTVMITHIDRSTVDRSIEKIVAADNQLFLFIKNQQEDLELWVCKGSETSTYKLSDLGLEWLEEIETIAYGSELYFTDYSFETGRELWSSDGTVAGTRVRFDVEPGPASSFPQKLIAAGNHLYFTAYTREYGRQWWSFCETPDSRINAPERICTGGTDYQAHVDQLGPMGNYVWTISEGTITQGQGTAEIAFSPDGLMDVTLNVEMATGDGCDSQGSQVIAVDDGPLALLDTIQGPDRVCSFEEGVQYAVTPVQNVLEYQWTVPYGAQIVSGQGSAQIVVHFGESEGSVEVAAVNGCGVGAPVTLQVSFYTPPIAAEAGPDQEVCGNSTELNATSIPGITGYWELVSGVGGTIQDIYNPNSEFSGLETELYHLRWVLDHSPCPNSSDDVYITFYPVPSSDVDAGEDIEICENGTYLNAVPPVYGTGMWSCEDASLYIRDPYAPNSYVSGDYESRYTLRWTVYSGTCDPVWDEVILKIYSQPVKVFAGPDWFILDGDSVQLEGRYYPDGYYLWSVESGPSLVSTQFADQTDPETLFTPEGGPGYYKLSLNRSVGNCGSAEASCWVKSGSAYDTPIMITNCSSDPDSQLNTNSFVFKDYLYFFSETDMMRCRGTAETVELFVPNLKRSSSVYVIDQNRVFFVADGKVGESWTGSELWVTDGTPEGTRLVKDIASGSDGSQIGEMILMNDIVYFTTERYDGNKLWRSDGTSIGTYRLVPSNFGLRDFKNLTVMNNTLFFAAADYSHGVELWKSDGTYEGTVLVKDIYPGQNGGLKTNIAPLPFQSHLFFLAYEPDSGLAIWKTDGTSEGTHFVVDVGVSKGFYSSNECLYFSYEEYGLHDYQQLYRSDGSSEGTVELPNVKLYRNSDMFYFNQSLVFCGDYNGQAGLYRLSNDSVEPVLLYNTSWGLSDFQTIGSQFLFEYWKDNESKSELFLSDGTPEGTGLLVDMTPQPQVNTFFDSFSEYAGNLVFQATTRTRSNELWRICTKPDLTMESPEYLCNETQEFQISVPDAGYGALYAWDVDGAEILSGEGTNSLMLRSNGADSVDVHIYVEVLGSCSNQASVQIEYRDIHLEAWFDPESYLPDIDADQNGTINVLDYVLHLGNCL
ncbi:MAG: hypothetical protein CSA81_03185 [Acidobacteria bacterium]|nr:MAG: hypothetical protein CSA81_03185 [Acidobacteriota bacterium]